MFQYNVMILVIHIYNTTNAINPYHPCFALLQAFLRRGQLLFRKSFIHLAFLQLVLQGLSSLLQGAERRLLRLLAFSHNRNGSLCCL